MPNLIRAACRAGRRPAPAGSLFTAVALALVAGPLAGPAAAHTELRASTPAKNAQVGPPSEVELVFTERLRASLVRVQIIDAEGRRHESGEPVVSGGTVTQRVKGRLAAGRYATVYYVISADGHPVKGEVPFTVVGGGSNARPAAPGNAAGAGPNAAKAPDAAPGAPGGGAAEAGGAGATDGVDRASPGTVGWGWVIAGLLAAAGAGAAIVLWRKRASSS